MSQRRTTATRLRRVRSAQLTASRREDGARRASRGCAFVDCHVHTGSRECKSDACEEARFGFCPQCCRMPGQITTDTPIGCARRALIEPKDVADLMCQRPFGCEGGQHHGPWLVGRSASCVDLLTYYVTVGDAGGHEQPDNGSRCGDLVISAIVQIVPLATPRLTSRSAARPSGASQRSLYVVGLNTRQRDSHATTRW